MVQMDFKVSCAYNPKCYMYMSTALTMACCIRSYFAVVIRIFIPPQAILCGEIHLQ
jgi:putative component of membrane protein insertase Oxa1/YidC/SpoIIIJ protein YidD